MAKKVTIELGTIYRRKDGRSPFYVASWYVGAKQIRESTGTADEKEAWAYLRKRQQETRSGIVVPTTLTVEAVLRGVIDDYKFKARSDDSVYELTTRVEGTLIPRLGKIKAREWRASHGKRYITQRQAEGVKLSTVQRELAIVRRAFRLALENELLDRMPMVPHVRQDNVREGFLEEEGYQKLLAELPAHVRPLLIIGYHVGMRAGELLKLEAGMVDLAGKVIRVSRRTTKGNREKLVPIYGDMKTAMERLCEGRSGHDRLFTMVEFDKAWASACTRAGCPGLLFHDLRRSAVRNMMQVPGMTEKRAMEISGHRTRAVFDRYNIVVESQIREAGTMLEAAYKQRRAKASKLALVPKQQKA
jgi:integrase